MEERAEWTWAAPESGGAEQRVGPPPVAGVTPTSAPPHPGSAEADRSAPSGPPPLPAAVGPLTVADMLDGAWTVLKRRPRTVFTLTAVLLVPVEVAAAWIQRGALSIFDPEILFGSSAGTADPVADLGPVLLLAVLRSLAFMLLSGAIARLVTGWYAGRDLPPGQVLRDTFARALPLAGVWVLAGGIELTGMCVAFVGFLVAAAFTCVTAQVVVVERANPAQALRRSFLLVSRRFWIVVAMVVLTYLVEYLVSLAFLFLPLLLTALLGDTVASEVVFVVTAALSRLLTAPALAAAFTLVYLDLRVRAEGLDLELDAAEAFAGAR